VRARQAPRPDGPCPRGGLQRPQDFEGLCEFFRRHGHGAFPGCLWHDRAFIISLRVSLIMLLSCTFISILRCTIIIVLCRGRNCRCPHAFPSGLGVKTHATERAALVNNDALSSFRRYLLLRRKDARQMVSSVYFPNHLVRTLQVVSVLEGRV
jgi:hypothetical protein